MGDRCREPKRYYLGVLVFPQEADGRVRLFVDQMVPTYEWAALASGRPAWTEAAETAAAAQWMTASLSRAPPSVLGD